MFHVCSYFCCYSYLQERVFDSLACSYFCCYSYCRRRCSMFVVISVAIVTAGEGVRCL